MEIGAKIKQLRLQCSLTQEELADRCDLTKGYISQLENELTSPSIATLIDILSALGTNLSAFFSDEKDEQVVFTENDFFEKLTEEEKIVWLVPNSQKNEMEPIIVEIRPTTKLSKDMPHEGEEFGFVLEGNIILYLGKKSYKVKKGEAFYFESKKEHFLENPTNKTAKLIWVSSPPTF
ncbi:MAG TPA: XRE family transcriptional regulator [Clostridia bacterium]|nr:XRE family transcriptional regulator [Clostridia bacterium]